MTPFLQTFLLPFYFFPLFPPRNFPTTYLSPPINKAAGGCIIIAISSVSNLQTCLSPHQHTTHFPSPQNGF